MPNFSQRFAMRCTEQQWKNAKYEGKPLSVQLIALGYDLSELKFYPNKPYVVTFYKQNSSKISTTNTPFKESRKVMDEFDPALFYALCCQLEGEHVTVGEFITTKQGKVHQIHSLQGNWLRHDYPDGKNTAFAKASVRKSTFAELFAWYSEKNVSEVKKDSKGEDETFKRNPGRNGKTLEPESPAESKLVAATKILSSEKAMTIEEMTQTAKAFGPKSKVVPRIDFSAIVSPASEIIISQETDSQPMDFKSLLCWYAEHNSIVWGIVEGGEIHSETKVISHISKENAQLIGVPEPTEFSQLFRSQHHFLTYALTKI